MAPYTITGLRLAPPLISRLLLQIGAEDLDLRLDPDRFGPKEIVAHLADWESVFLSRMQGAVREPGTSVEAFDEGEWAILHDYASSDAGNSVALYRQRRSATLDWARELGSEELNRWYLHPERGRVTVGETLEMMLGHDLYHAEQLSEYIEPTTPDA